MPARIIAMLVAIPLTALVLAQSPLNEDLLKMSWEGQDALVKTFLEMGADVDARDEFGQTPLMAAVSQGHIDTVRVLVEGGADVNATDAEGDPVLSFTDDDQIIELLADAGATLSGGMTLEEHADRLRSTLLGLVSILLYIVSFIYFGLFYAEQEGKGKLFGLLVALGCFALSATTLVGFYFESTAFIFAGLLMQRGLIGYASYYVADKKNRNRRNWSFATFVFGPLLLLIVLYLPRADRPWAAAEPRPVSLELNQETPSQGAEEKL